MRGTRAIVLLEPNPTGELSGTGQPIMGEPYRHSVLAERMDRRGSEGFVAAGVLGGDWQVEFRIRASSLARRPDETWTLVDDLDAHYDIEQVAEGQSGPRPRTLHLTCARRAVRPVARPG